MLLGATVGAVLIGAVVLVVVVPTVAVSVPEELPPPPPPHPLSSRTVMQLGTNFIKCFIVVLKLLRYANILEN